MPRKPKPLTKPERMARERSAKEREATSKAFRELSRARWAKMTREQATPAASAAFSPARVKKPTACRRCGAPCASGREAWNHCGPKKD